MAELASKTPPLIPPEEAEEKAASIWSESWKGFKKNKMAIIGLSLVIFFILLAIFAPIIAPYSFEEQNLSNKHLSPSAEHWFGTDEFGRDIFSRIILWFPAIIISRIFISCRFRCHRLVFRHYCWLLWKMDRC